MKYSVEVMRVREQTIQLNGWAVENAPDSVITYRIEDEAGNPVDAKIVPTRRDDVSQIYYKKIIDRDLGFDIRFPYEHGKIYYLVICGEKKTTRVKYSDMMIRKKTGAANRKVQKLMNLMNMETVHVAWDFLKENGLKALILKSKHKIQGIDDDYDYAEWWNLTKPSEEELEAQKKETFEYMPKFSIVIPVYKTPEKFLKEMLDSIVEQTYANWELCIADGSPAGESVENVLKKYAEKDSRIRYKVLGENLGISGNTNAALEMAEGDFVVLADHDDRLTPNALFECAKKLNENRSCDVLYSDEDKLDMDGDELFDPHFKPDFNIDLLCSVNYICHLFVVSHDLAAQVGGFRQEYDGAQDYDFIFRCTEKAKEIRHIPKVLYHWRCHKDSTASNPESKLYAFDAGARAIMDHYKRVGIEAERVEKGVDYGIYHSVYKIQGEPLVSIIIPNKDHSVDLDLCIRSIIERATYKNLEFIVVENNSTEQETFAYYEKIQKEFPQVKVVRWEREFNYSAINNFGAAFAKGEYLMLLNNDTEIIASRLFEEMLGFCQRKEVGIVGARLLYEDDTIQHAGVVIGFGGVAGHTFIGLHEAENSYFHRAMCAQDYSAVTAACLMVKKSVFEEVGGLTEELAVAFNDVDFCLKVRAAGYLVVYAPYAVMHHYESKSRGLEDTPEKVARFNREWALVAKRWPDILQNGDPYYNPNLTLRKSDFSLRDLLKEKIGEPYKLPEIKEQ